jgi:hypothetical protein
MCTAIMRWNGSGEACTRRGPRGRKMCQLRSIADRTTGLGLKRRLVGESRNSSPRLMERLSPMSQRSYNCGKLSSLLGTTSTHSASTSRMAATMCLKTSAPSALRTGFFKSLECKMCRRAGGQTSSQYELATDRGDASPASQFPPARGPESRAFRGVVGLGLPAGCHG